MSQKTNAISARLLNISSEIGELNKEYLNLTKYGTADFNVDINFKLEFGDVLYTLLSLANETNINSEECLKLALQKYSERMKNNNSLASK